MSQNRPRAEVTKPAGTEPERFENPGLPEHPTRMADVDPRARGEQLTTADFVRIAEAARRLGIGQVRREP